MERKRRKEFKKKYKEEQSKSDIGFQLLHEFKQQILQVSKIETEQLAKWKDDELEQNIVLYVQNRFEVAGKPPKGENLMEWERSILQKVPAGVSAVFATYLFESDLYLNGSYWDFFYQNNGAFAKDALDGYKLMDNVKMVKILEQCIGAYLIMRQNGEIEELWGVLHSWEFNEDDFINLNNKSFEELDGDYQLQKKSLYEELKTKKIQFIRGHPEFFITGSNNSIQQFKG